MTNDELAAFILPWAKEHHPEKYEQTISVSPNAKTFRRYLIRLVEIRWANETNEWRGTIPLSVLEESAISMTVRSRKTTSRFVVKGRLAEGPREWSFGELAELLSAPEPMRALRFMQQAKEVLDLEVVS